MCQLYSRPPQLCWLIQPSASIHKKKHLAEQRVSAFTSEGHGDRFCAGMETFFQILTLEKWEEEKEGDAGGFGEASIFSHWQPTSAHSQLHHRARSVEICVFKAGPAKSRAAAGWFPSECWITSVSQRLRGTLRASSLALNLFISLYKFSF